MSDNCIIWRGAKNNKGYGHGWFNGVYMTAHRWAYTFHKGPIPEGKIIRHTCDNRACINPNHLITGTYIENMQDAKERERKIGRYGNSPRKDRIEAIHSGLSDQEIARKFNTSSGAIWKLRKSLEVR